MTAIDSAAITTPQPIQRPKSMFADLKAGWAYRDLWLMQAVLNVKLRYRRTFFGPFWITITIVGLILAFGLLRGLLFRTDVREFLPYITVGMISFFFAVSILQSATGLFGANTTEIENPTLPYSVTVYRTLTEALIVFAHTAVVYLAMLIWPGARPSWWSLVVIPLWLLLMVLLGVGLMYWLAPISAKYADLSQIVSSLVIVSFILTPIWWQPEDFAGTWREWVIYLNPFAWVVMGLRGPLVSGQADTQYWLFLGLLAAGAIVLLGAAAIRFPRLDLGQTILMRQ